MTDDLQEYAHETKMEHLKRLLLVITAVFASSDTASGSQCCSRDVYNQHPQYKFCQADFGEFTLHFVLYQNTVKNDTGRLLSLAVLIFSLWTFTKKTQN